MGRRPRMVAVCLVVAAAATAAWVPYGGADEHRPPPLARSAAGREPALPPVLPPVPSPPSSPRGDDAVTVDAPVRIPDAEAVRLLRPGDRVDVLAAPAGDSSADVPADRARIIARDARVTAVPGSGPGTGAGSGTGGGDGTDGGFGADGEAGALVVLSVSRATAARLAAAAAHSRLAVTLC
ncbi:MAG TPA: RcpC/CpaB family pilus assembly protein [Streptomyces sp.]|nr:RcpC/CpaB family pilus assembly protein [Streptomyces sp.]